MNFLEMTLEEVNAAFTRSEFVDNYHNGIGKTQGNDVSFLNHEALRTSGLTEDHLGNFQNGSVTLHMGEGENKNAHYADVCVIAVTNAQGTLLCGRKSID